MREWKNYLLFNNLLSQKSEHNLDFLTDYFTFTNAVDLMHTCDIDINLSLLNVSLPKLLNTNYLNNFENYIVFFSDVNFYAENELTTAIKDLVSSISEQVLIKNDAIKIVNFFPGYETQNSLMNIELWYYDRDNNGSSINELSTPDVKLYYPEPFIASPSFNHEEI